MLDSLIIILWSFCLKRLLTMKKQPVVSVRGELSQFLAYGFTFSLIMLVVFLVVWVLSV